MGTVHDDGEDEHVAKRTIMLKHLPPALPLPDEVFCIPLAQDLRADL